MYSGRKRTIFERKNDLNVSRREEELEQKKSVNEKNV